MRISHNVEDSRECRRHNSRTFNRKMMKTEFPEQTRLEMTEVPQEQFGKEKVSTTCRSCQEEVLRTQSEITSCISLMCSRCSLTWRAVLGMKAGCSPSSAVSVDPGC